MGIADFLSCGNDHDLDCGGGTGSKGEREGIGKLGVRRGHARLGGIRRAVGETAQTSRPEVPRREVQVHGGEKTEIFNLKARQRLRTQETTSTSFSVWIDRGSPKSLHATYMCMIYVTW